ncbi:N-acetylmuramoyl-L-alanine amidase [Flammeovirga sp. SubArs3]|uniref:golvesin C-terminal-like domain-containing protein n=1 Tax=Flammeovirga sp. SubArs3 TaxID=2995316 RepID=UPI00248CFFF5|nr:N-acetylmuramoyl-L-alanine amidase [Flammeovirga sp. SubArs3]
MYKHFFSLLYFFALTTLSTAQSKNDVITKFNEYLLEAKNGEYHYQPDSTARLDTVYLNSKKKKLILFLGKQFEYRPVRNEDVEDVYQKIRLHLGDTYKQYDITLFVGKSDKYEAKKLAKKNKWPIAPKCEFKDLIPNINRYKHTVDKSRNLTKIPHKHLPHVIRVDQDKYTKGLYGKHIALWNSHGWYYEKSQDRWEWQRARLFQTVEDLLPTSFVLPYLSPMLENAGANVYMPRERDIQIQSLVVDNDGDRNGYSEKGTIYAGGNGFLHKEVYNDNEQPFSLGTYRKFRANKKKENVIHWSTLGQVKGNFAVYISYASLPMSVDDATYTVQHQGQQSIFKVNQKMGGGTWVYLGHFYFDGSEGEGVKLSSYSKHNDKMITADAVRFGGGVGNIQRGGSTSRRARFLEGARYNLQYAGAPLNVYTPNENENDYKDDYQSRGEWVNWMVGDTYALNPEIENKGLNIPIDLSLALHTNSGISESDTTEGTLLIYSTTDMEKNLIFPDQQSRYTNRDLADIVQTQIVDDIRVLYDSIWNRRELWDRRYSEAVYPNVPTILIELLSHQNFKDMRFAMNPKFKFDVSRAIYKGVLKYLAYQYNQPYIVQPLKPVAFSTSLSNGEAILQWKPQLDPLEKTAVPTYYKVYTNINNKGWSKGEVVKEAYYKVKVSKGDMYRFKVIAFNEGGQSFPSEELALADFGNKPYLIVNAFERVSGPSIVVSENFSGFTNLDDGVADNYDVSFTGHQYDFNPASEWIDDDAPGHGASYADLETTVVNGNSHDFTKIHGEAFYYLQQSFVSVSKQSVVENTVRLTDYQFVDLLFGEQKSTMNSQKDSIEYECFDDVFKDRIKSFLDKKGSQLFLSGAYIGTDLFYSEDGVNKGRKHPDAIFGKNYFHFIGRSNHADRSGNIYATMKEFPSFKDLTYAKSYSTSLYPVEAPDALDAADKSTKVIARYVSSNKSVGIAYKGDKNAVVALGIPFETINQEQKRIELMREIIEYFK